MQRGARPTSPPASTLHLPYPAKKGGLQTYLRRRGTCHLGSRTRRGPPVREPACERPQGGRPRPRPIPSAERRSDRLGVGWHLGLYFPDDRVRDRREAILWRDFLPTAEICRWIDVGITMWSLNCVGITLDCLRPQLYSDTIINRSDIATKHPARATHPETPDME